MSPSSVIQKPAPDVYYAVLNFDPALVPPDQPFPINFPVTTPKSYKYCMKVGTTVPGGWDNNIFLHFQKYNDDPTTSGFTGRILQLGAQPGFIMLTQTLFNFNRKVYAKCGLPTTLFFSCDFQGIGAYKDLIAFWDDDFDLTDVLMSNA